MDILWNCLSTIILCVWKSLHCNVTDGTTEKLTDCAFCLVAPEGMASFALADLLSATKLRKELRESTGWKSFTLKQSFVTVKGGLRIKRSPTADFEHLDPNGLFRYARSGRLRFSMLPTDDDINMRNKTDWLTKLIAFGQTAWFAADIVGRLSQGYQVSLVEDITAAYVFCAVSMYCCYAQCPQDLQESWDLTLEETEGGRSTTEIPCGEIDVERASAYFACWILLAIFIGIHLAAWSYPFPSLSEAWLWRAASTCLVSGFLVLYSLRNEWEVSSNLKQIALYSAVAFYSIARLLLVALAFSSLRKAPQGIYEKPVWTAYWGHIGN